MQLQFDPIAHEYRHAGKVVRSVTQVLKGAGLVDDRWYTEESSDSGTGAHAAIEAWIKFGDDESGPIYAPYLKAYQRFLAETGFIVTDSERRLYSAVWGYAGTADLFGFLNDRFACLDIKTGAPLRVHGVQLAAYADAYAEETQTFCDTRGGLYLSSDGTYKIRNYEDPNDINVFRSALTIVNYLNQ